MSKTDSLTGWLSVWLAGWLAGWLSGCLAVWVSGCLSVWLSGRLSVLLPLNASRCVVHALQFAHWEGIDSGCVEMTWGFAGLLGSGARARGFYFIILFVSAAYVATYLKQK